MTVELIDRAHGPVGAITGSLDHADDVTSDPIEIGRRLLLIEHQAGRTFVRFIGGDRSTTEKVNRFERVKNDAAAKSFSCLTTVDFRTVER